jgi:hypothetical protein
MSLPKIADPDAVAPPDAVVANDIELTDEPAPPAPPAPMNESFRAEVCETVAAPEPTPPPEIDGAKDIE